MRLKTSTEGNAFRASIVNMISVARSPEEAVKSLSRYYKVEAPRLKIGLPKGENKALGCYQQRDRTIYVSSQEYLYDPYVIIHEFYHHLRNVSGKHRGTEKHAKEFALMFLRTDRT